MPRGAGPHLSRWCSYGGGALAWYAATGLEPKRSYDRHWRWQRYGRIVAGNKGTWEGSRPRGAGPEVALHMDQRRRGLKRRN